MNELKTNLVFVKNKFLFFGLLPDKAPVSDLLVF